MKDIKIKGGKAFNFEGTPPATLKTCYTNNRLVVQLVIDEIELTTNCKTNKQIEPFQAFAQIGKNEDLKLSLPYKTKVEQLDLKEKKITFSKLGNKQKYPQEKRFSEKWIQSGLWLELKNTITGKHINPSQPPERIFIQTFHSEPFNPDSDILAKIPDIQCIQEIFHDLFGLKIKITLIVNQDNKDNFQKFENLADLFILPQKYPATDPGILLSEKYYPYGYKLNPDKYWTMDVFTVRNLINLYYSNEFPEAYFTVGGCHTSLNGHYCTDYWFPFSQLFFDNKIKNETAILIQGGLLNGEKQKLELATTIPGNRNFSFLEQRQNREFLHFLRPGLKRDSFSPLYLSYYLPRVKKEVSTGLRGEKRFCLSCNSCVDICPVGLDPQILWKLATNKLHEEAASLGAARCLNCKLCTYVCPSKIELSQKISSEKNYFFLKIAKDNK